MKEFRIPSNNPYEDRVRAFLESKKGQDLQTRYDSSPYEEENGVFDTMAMIASYVCNGVSAVTASTYVFSYFFSVFAQLPAPSLIAGFITASVLIALEVLQRWFSSKFFRRFYKLKLIKNGMKLYGSTLRGFGIGMLICAALSILFSHNGSFDFVTTVTNPPAYEAPELIDIKEIEKRYATTIAEAKESADEFVVRRKWKNRLSTVDAQKWEKLTARKAELEDESLAEIKKAETKNENTISQAKEEHEKALALYEEKSKAKGGGLAVIAVCSILLFFLCMWFREHYNYKTLLQYAVLTESESSSYPLPSYNPSPTLPLAAPTKTTPVPSAVNPDLAAILSQLAKDVQELKQDRKSVVDLTKEPYSHNGHSRNGETEHRTIGFNKGDMQHAHVANVTMPHLGDKKLVQTHVHASTQELPEAILQIVDRFTIEHRNFSNGKVQHLNYQTVQNRIDDYTARVAEANRKGDEKALANRKAKLLYWESRKAELLAKAQASI